MEKVDKLPEGAIKVPPFCEHHRERLIQGAKYKETDNWRIMEVIANKTMFQGATTTPSVFKVLKGDITRLPELGCLACRLPAKFDKVINVAKSHDIVALAKLGDNWVREAAKDPDNITNKPFEE